MKITSLIFFLFTAFIFEACSGSDTYRGSWYATDSNGTHAEIVFNPNNFTITQAVNFEKFDYTQNSVKTSNFVKTYGINLNDGSQLRIQFPLKNDQSKGAILDVDYKVIYIISRKEYINYDDVYGLTK